MNQLIPKAHLTQIKNIEECPHWICDGDCIKEKLLEILEKLPKLKKTKFEDADWLKHQKAGFNEAITQVEEIIETGATIYDQFRPKKKKGGK